MVLKFKLILATVAILFSGSAAFAQCSGQFTAGQLCANSGLSQGLPSGTNLTTLFDSLYGASAGTIIYRGPTSWQSLPGNITGTQILSENGSGVPAWLTVSGTGTVTSVGLSAPSEFTVSGSPVTSTGTLTFVEANESANTFAAGPTSGGAAPWAFRGLVIGDFPSIAANTVIGNGTGSGAVPTALSVPSCSGASNALIWTTNTGFGCNTITTSLAAIPSDNVLANATGGSAAPIGVALGNCAAAQQALTYNTSTHVFGCNTISGSGTVVAGAAGQIAYYGGSTNVVNGNVDANISAGALTLGLASTTIGQLILEGNTSGAVTLTPQAAAGTPTITFGTSSGTPVVTASSPLAITTATGNLTITGAAGKVLAGSGPAFTATPTLGIASTTTGALNFVGTTSGTVTLSVADAAGTWTMKLPSSGGTNGQFLETDGSGNASWASPSGSGTVNAGTSGQMTYYGSSGSAVSGNANANISSGALTLGQASSTIGQLILDGSTSGAVTITPQAVAGTFNFNLPTTAGAAGQALTSQGGGAAAMSWTTVAATAPQMRLTLASGVPVTTADQSGITAHYCTPYPGGSASATSFVPITTDGSTFSMTSSGELTQTAADNTKSPAAVANNSVYDVFLWSDSGTIRCTRGPAWSSDTVRGSGAGTSEIDFTTKFPTNKNSITNGPAANRGVLLGSLRSNGSAAFMDTALFRWTSNAYNPIDRQLQLALTGNASGYASATWKQWNSSAANEVDVLQTLTGFPVHVSARGAASDTSINSFCPIGIGIDSSSSPSGFTQPNQLGAIGNTQTSTSEYVGYVGLGRHFIAILEYASSGTCTQIGSASLIQSGLIGTVAN